MALIGVTRYGREMDPDQPWLGEQVVGYLPNGQRVVIGPEDTPYMVDPNGRGTLNTPGAKMELDQAGNVVQSHPWPKEQTGLSQFGPELQFLSAVAAAQVPGAFGISPDAVQPGIFEAAAGAPSSYQYLAQAPGVGGSVTSTVTPVGDGQVQFTGGAPGDTLGYGGWENVPSNGVTAPAGIPLPGGGDVYGSPAVILKAVKDGLLPAAALKGIIGKGGALDSILKMMQSGQDTTALSRMTGISSDLLDVLGKVASTGLGVYGASQQADAFKRLSDDAMTRWNQSVAMGAPSRDRYEASFKPGFTMASDPGYQDALDATTKATLHGLSVTGSPATSPNAWAQTLSDVNSKFAFPALQNYRNTNATTGGYSSFNSAAGQGPNTSAAVAAIGADAGMNNAIGAGIADLTTPRNTLEDFFRRNDIFKYG